MKRIGRVLFAALAIAGLSTPAAAQDIRDIVRDAERQRWQREHQFQQQQDRFQQQQMLDELRRQWELLEQQQYERQRGPQGGPSDRYCSPITGRCY